MDTKKWSIRLLLITLVLLLLCAGTTAVIDPFFHYHAPLEGLQYPIDDQRYQNDGIVRHFSYDALITGTSMTENFRTSDMDRLFQVHSVKTSFSGGTLEELSANLRRALAENPDCRLVLFGLDAWHVLPDRALIQADGDYPTYLYDDDPFNDMAYLLNKDVFFGHTLAVLDYTRQGGKTTSFDDYSRWSEDYLYGSQAVLATYVRDPMAPAPLPYTPELRLELADSLEDTLLALAREHPDVTFLYFFTPHSILKWDRLVRTGRLDQQIEAYAQASSLLLAEENIQLYSFFTDLDLIAGLEHYKDISHYSGEVNTWILEQIAAGGCRLTEDNFRDHWDQVAQTYQDHDYDALFQG